jgi:dGTPase
MTLATYAITEATSRGREYDEPAHPYRSGFERDRDRVIHSSAFRRLEGKTQVFTPGLDDYYRTRLTHSIEVAQIGRTVAKALGLNQDLTEAICLAHDLGHSPFGHVGEQVLNRLLAAEGGFEHNAQTLRVVTLLEHPYPGFMGLNLLYETRLGLARHQSPYDEPAADDYAETQGSLEAQVANVADRIAYNCHDLEDGQRARLLALEDLKSLALFAEAEQQIRACELTDRTLRRTRTSKSLINLLVGDCIETSCACLTAAGIVEPQQVYAQAQAQIRLSPLRDRQLRQVESYLLDRFYHHPTLRRHADDIETWLSRLFAHLCRHPEAMPKYFQRFIDTHGRARAVADYMAGMTDRFCLALLETM